jgi:RimJ/RimL family protein N-acetyltransferase
LAVTFLDNLRSNSLLNKIGFKLKGNIELYQAQNNLYEYTRKSC